MDFGFASGNDAHHVNLRSMFSRRASTTLVHRRDVLTVHELIDHLASTATPPIGDILIGTHAGSKGFLTVPFSRGQNGRSDFEAAHDSIGTGSDSIAIPDSLIGHTSGSPISHNVHIKGCNVGVNRVDTTRSPPAPFLVKLKEAFGGHVNVTAPKHFHGLDPARGLGVFEYMAYEFKVGVTPTLNARRRLVGFADKAAALTAFKAAQFRYIDNTLVPDADWVPLIPDNITRTRNEGLTANLGQTVGTRTTMNIRRQFRVETDDVEWTLTFPTAGDIPGSEAGRLNALKIDIPKDDRFKAAHPFPQYERLGFRTFNDFFAGYHWSFRTSGRDLICVGLRFIYTVLLAIVNRTTGNIFFNFYPDAGSSVPAVTNGLVVTDARFFGSS